MTKKNIWNLNSLAGMIFAIFLLCLISVAAQTRTYETIAPDGAVYSVANGINARGDVVGTFVDENYVYHGFVFSRGTYTVVDFPIELPQTGGTDLRGIGPNGELVGSYWFKTDSFAAMRGFKWDKKYGFTNVHFPGHQWEILQRIMPDGTILGCTHDDEDMSMRGIQMGKAGSIEVPFHSSMHNGATPDLQLIVGLYTNMDAGARTEAYTLDNGVFTPFVVPGAVMSAAWDVNPAGQIVGVFKNATGFNGFVRTGEAYETIRFPGSAATRVFGINARGDVVGRYVLSGVSYGFIAR